MLPHSCNYADKAGQVRSSDEKEGQEGEEGVKGFWWEKTCASVTINEALEHHLWLYISGSEKRKEDPSSSQSSRTWMCLNVSPSKKKTNARINTCVSIVNSS